jgi:hypothetical protein
MSQPLRRLSFAIVKLEVALDAGIHSEEDASELWVRFRYYCSSFRGRPRTSEALSYLLIERVAHALRPWRPARSSNMMAAVKKHGNLGCAAACAACAA